MWVYRLLVYIFNLKPACEETAFTDSTSNCTSEDTITVFVKAPAGSKSFIPNFFTPNGEGQNDCFKVNHFGTVKTVDMIIYNRFGNAVFAIKNVTECWGETYKGQPADVGNYAYYIKVLNNCGEEIKKGNLLLLRKKYSPLPIIKVMLFFIKVLCLHTLH